MSIRMRAEAGFLVVEIRGPIEVIPECVIQAVECSDRVRLVLDTPGGDARSTLCLADALLRVTESLAEVEGMACSAGADLLAACQRCTIRSSGRVMIHRANIGVLGGVRELTAALEQLEDVDARARRLLERRCRPELVAAWFDGADHYLTAEEALAAGLVDEILPDQPASVDPTSFELKKRCQVEPTESERVALAVLDALGPIEASHLGAFSARLNLWFRERVHEKAAPV